MDASTIATMKPLAMVMNVILMEICMTSPQPPPRETEKAKYDDNEGTKDVVDFRPLRSGLKVRNSVVLSSLSSAHVFPYLITNPPPGCLLQPECP